jgi:two-component system, OmpR family, KDP operon response regulator KdpE
MSNATSLQSVGPSPAEADILVVEDEPSISRLLKVFFASLGYQTRFAASGTEAVAVIEKAPPDLVLLDMYLPNLNGVQVLHKLRSRFGSELPFGVIVLTGSREEPLLQEALDLGATDVLLKPVNLSQVELAVRVQLLLKPPVHANA